MANDDGMWLNSKLDAAEAEEFELVQSYHGIKTRSDVVRFLIRAEARRISRIVNTAPVPALVGGQPDHLS